MLPVKLSPRVGEVIVYSVGSEDETHGFRL